MKAGRIVTLVIGCLLVLPALALTFGGGALALAYGLGRDDGYFEVSLDRLQTDTAAIVASDIDLAADPGTPDWLLDRIDLDVRLQVDRVDPDTDLFVGIGREDDVAGYLDGIGRDEIVEIDGRTPRYERRFGVRRITPPVEEDFWVASASGADDLELEWQAESGRWAVVLMNADGSRGVVADVDVGARSDLVLPLAIGALVAGIGLTAVAVTLILVATAPLRGGPAAPPGAPAAAVGAVAPEPAPDEPGAVREPVSLHAAIDPDLSSWQWLVKWFLAIPHAIVLVFLWLAFVVTTVVAGIAILFTGRYPPTIFDFNVGVLRWTWRVAYYAGPGGLGTDRYPPFSLDDDPDYPARLTIEPPGELSRGLVLVKWWLLAIPHYLIIAAFTGGAAWGADTGTGGISLIGVLVFVAAVILLFTGTYRRSLFDLIIGLDRWIVRVIAYAALMTDRYPPFRLDQGGDEPTLGVTDGGGSPGA